MVTVCPATKKDGEIAVRIVRRSIEELCAADHHNDLATLASWLANKTPENLRSCVSDPDNFCVVAEAGAWLSGVEVAVESERRGSQNLAII